jgi:hypothetical protein
LRSLFAFAGVVAVSLVACGGGGSSNPAPAVNAIPVPAVSPTIKPTTSPTTAASSTPTPTAAPTPSVTPTVLSVSPASLAFSAAGSGSPTQSVTAAQPDASAGFTLSTTTCGGIVTVTPTKGAGPFIFSALKAGSCSYTITGGAQKITLPITVTTTTVHGT